MSFQEDKRWFGAGPPWCLQLMIDGKFNLLYTRAYFGRVDAPRVAGEANRLLRRLDIPLTRFYIFLIRAFMAVGFAILLTRMFYPNAGMIKIIGVAFGLIAMAYIFESFRGRTKDSKLKD
jgi:hypothetical protein